MAEYMDFLTQPDAFIISYPGGLQESLELLGEGCLRGSANKLVYQLATLEEEDGRDITNTKLHSDVVVLLLHHTYLLLPCRQTPQQVLIR